MRQTGQHGGVETAGVLVTSACSAGARIGTLVALRVEAERESGTRHRSGQSPIDVQAGATYRQ